MREGLFAPIAVLALVGSQAMAAPSLPAQEVIPGKGVMQRWVVDPSIAPPPTTGGGRFGTITALSANDTSPCTESEFRAVSSSGASTAALVNRHKYCQEYQGLPQVLQVDLMRRTATSQWEYYRPGVNPYEARGFNVGTIVLRTRIHAFGAGDRLAKMHKIDVSAVSFAFDSQFPAHLQAGVSLTLHPDGGAQPPTDSDIQNFSIDVGTFNPITLNANTASGTTGAFDVRFNWTYGGSDPMQNFAQLAVFVPRYLYQINNTPNIGFPGMHFVTADNSASWLFFQRLRCDKGVASGNSAPAAGCIFEEASPIFELSATGSASEEALHVYHAQRNTDAYKTQLSPGVFKAAAGIRAVADESGGDHYRGLERGTAADSAANRLAACTASNALFKMRPYSGSASCPSPSSPDCECDEYPFAATKQGGYYMPSATSVRRINASHNSSGGGQLQAFYIAQRVFHGEKFWVKVTGVQ